MGVELRFLCVYHIASSKDNVDLDVTPSVSPTLQLPSLLQYALILHSHL